MRSLLALTLFATACTGVPVSGPTYDSVRERLTDVPTSLYVHDEASSGTVMARRRGRDGWITGPTQLAIERGYVRAAIDDSGQLAINQLDIELAPIALDVFEKPAQLENLHVHLAKPVRGDVVWTSEDDATATLAIAFDFDWALTFEGAEPYPLATQHLPAANVQVMLGGSGDHVGAQLDLEASGELWNWADLIQITEISASLDAETAD